MKKTLGLGLLSLLAVGAAGAALVSGPVFNAGAAETITDKLTADNLGATGTSYKVFTNLKVSSDAVYAGTTAKSNTGAIQLKSKDSVAGIVSTSSGGNIRKIEVVWDSASANGRQLDVYGYDKAYSAASELYDTSSGSQLGTKIGSITYGTSTSLDITADYAFVGLRSYTGAMYLTSISLTWEPLSTTSYAVDTTGIYNATVSGPDSIFEGRTATYTITPNEGYDLPASVEDFIVEGATIDSYNSETGILVISNPTGEVIIMADMQVINTYPIAFDITNGTVTGDAEIKSRRTATFTIVPNVSYKLPASAEDILIENATLDSYDASTGIVILSNATDAVTVMAECEPAVEYPISCNLTGLTSSGDSSMYENGTASVTLAVVKDTTSLPTSIEVTGAIDYSYDRTSGIVTINGATGNVTITAVAISVPKEVSLTIDFSSDAWTMIEEGAHYTLTKGLITLDWVYTGTESSNAAGNVDSTSRSRFYADNVITISSVSGTGGVVTFNSIGFVAGSSTYATNLKDATVEVLSPSTGAGTISQTSSGTSCTYTVSNGNVTEFSFKMGKQARVGSIMITYLQDQTEVPLESISASYPEVLVSQTAVPTLTFNPSNASNRNVSYSIVSGSEYIELAEDGTVTGIGAGVATVRVTPEEEGVAPVDVNVTVNALPSIYGLTIGRQYAISSDSYEVTAVTGSIGGSATFTRTEYSATLSNSCAFTIRNGIYANTIALEVNLGDSVAYLGYQGSGSTVTLYGERCRESSWIAQDNGGSLRVNSVVSYSMFLTFVGSNFGCYGDFSNPVATYFTEIEAAAMSDEEVVQDWIDNYLHMSDYTENLGWCNDLAHGYYLTAKKGFNQLTDAQRSLFQTSDTFADARARYETWANFNNDGAPYDGYDGVQTPIQSSVDLFSSERTVDYVVYGTFLLTAVAAVGYLVYRRRRQA